MKKSTLAYQLLFGLILAVIGQPASADLVVDFSIDNGSTFSNSFNVLTGDSIQVGVYLADTQVGGILETDGLFGFGLAASTSPTDLGSITAASINPVFDFGITDTFTASTIEWEDAVFNNTIPTGQAILLGMFTYDTALDGSTLFTFAHNDPGSIKWLAGDGATVLDETIFGTGATGTFQLSINASAIPEPGSLTLMALVSVGLLIRCRR